MPRQRCWAGWTFGPNLPVHSPLLQKSSSPSPTSLSTSSSSPPLLCLGKSGWKACISTFFSLHHWHGAQHFVHIESPARFLRFKYWKSHEPFSWCWSLKYHIIPTPCHGQRQLPLDQVATSPIQLCWTYHLYSLSLSSFMFPQLCSTWWDNNTVCISQAAEPGSLIPSREFGYSTYLQQLSSLYMSCISVTVRYSCIWNKSFSAY